ncbi:MAG TPA: mannonate dehydratase [Bryobacteraceae bacterium]|nr:mannonate dehydratase [Bryobacteraceae bacterium]
MSASDNLDNRKNDSAAASRREFSKMALGGAALLASASKASATLRPIPPGIKIGTSAGQPTEDNLIYLKQLGVTWVSLAATPETATAEGFIKMREQWEAGGFHVYNIGSGVGPSGSLHNMPEVTLNLPGRDQKIAEYLNYLRYLGKAGIPYSTYAHMGNGIWRSGRATLPRGYTGADCDLSSPNLRGRWAGKTYAEPLSHGRVFSKEEIWDNYTYFIKKVVPVAEEAGVRIGIHPDDPPQPVLAGVPRCIFSNFEGYKRAIEIADSPNVGVCLCCGSWLEGGTMTGADPIQMIKHFGGMKKLFKIHFRNVSAPLPHFTETLIDDGYFDMSKVMQALVDIDFNGIVIPDHIPALGIIPGADNGPGGGGAGRGTPGQFHPNVGLAYLIACMNSMLKAAQNHKSRG